MCGGAILIDYRHELNDEQFHAVVSGGGPTMILAAAGSGKTRTMVYRVAYLLEQGVPPERILLITFTKKAAQEMLSRVESLCHIDVSGLWGGTFHHIGNIFLRKYGHLLAYQKNFTILDEQDANRLMDVCAKEKGMYETHDHFPKGEVLRSVLSYSINSGLSFAEVVQNKYAHLLSLKDDMASIAKEYARRKHALNLMDFDDLLLCWRDLLANHQDIRTEYAEQFLHILVDEYQDTNALQAEIIDMLASVHRNLMVVGDDFQSIYAFRGADFQNMLYFSDRYPDVRTYSLNTNYRSTPEIVKLASRSIEHNTMQFKKSLRSARSHGKRPHVITAFDSGEQAKFVAERIQRYLHDGVPAEEISVLYRAHHHAMELQVELRKQRIPFIVRSGLSFFEYAHVKDVIAYLRILVNPTDEPSWKRILELYKGVGPKASHAVWNYLSAHDDPLAATQTDEFLGLSKGKAKKALAEIQKTIQHLNTKTCRDFPSEAIMAVLQNGYDDYLRTTYDNYEERLDGIMRLHEYASVFSDVCEMLSDLALMSSADDDDNDKREGKVVLSTVHQSKGLEWSVVFVICVCENMFPLYRAIAEDAGGEEEERRLFYVAMTRAKNELYLLYPTCFLSKGEWKEVNPSRFLGELAPNEGEYSDLLSYGSARV